MTSETFRCGHPRIAENTRMDDIGPRCLTCRRALERRASQAYRARRKAEQQPMRGPLADALVAIALREPDPIERAAKLEILRKDGWIDEGRIAA